jgi:hypothetical protein
MTKTSPGDCSKLRAEALRLFEKGQEAELESRKASSAADKAHADLRKEEQNLRVWEEELQLASADKPNEKSSAESGGKKITSDDVALRGGAEQGAWSRYKSGEISAGELEEEWKKLDHDPDTLDKLRKSATDSRAARVKKATEEVAEASASTAETRLEVDKAENRKSLANSTYDYWADRAQTAEDAAADCEARLVAG